MAYLRRRLGSPHDVDDVYQEVLLAIYVSRYTYEPGCAVEPWVFAIAGHVLARQWRRSQVRARREVLFDVPPTESTGDAGPLAARGLASDRTAAGAPAPGAGAAAARRAPRRRRGAPGRHDGGRAPGARAPRFEDAARAALRVSELPMPTLPRSCPTRWSHSSCVPKTRDGTLARCNGGAARVQRSTPTTGEASPPPNHLPFRMRSMS
jgi:hypothetical protein